MQDVLGTLVPGGGLTRAELTIRPTPASVEEGDSDAIRALAGVATSLERELELQSLLGEGGMGIVRLALQKSLARQVAVKSMNPRARPGSARKSLLQEAHATATLEHPNIIPVHALAVDAQGDPHVVMRRIEGRTWRRYLAEPAAIQDDFGARDSLAWHLGVLMAVCNGVHYAHSRGILHRDLKPDNVMVGRFGEVWVLDWGLALRFTRDGPVRLPHARDETRIVGTPRFMAPEMARGDGAAMGPATDVYLLGGLLYVILTGHGPHPGAEIQETLATIPSFHAHVPPGTPPRLAAIARKALAADPADRHPTAEALRQDLQAFLEERSADRLARQAKQQLGALEHDLELDEPDRQQVYRHFGACRFGFQQALDAWPEHEEAHAGLERSLTCVARYELDQGDTRAASVHLAELASPPLALVARRDAMLDEQRRAQAEAALLRADLDPRLGQRTRMFVFGLVLLAWTLIPLAWWLLDRPLTYAAQIQSRGTMLLVIAGMVIWARESLGRTALNRRIAQLLVVMAASLVLGDLGGAVMGLSPVEVATFDHLLYAAVAALISDVVGRIALVPAVAYSLTFFACARYPELLLPLTAACNGLVTLIAFYRWGRDLPPRPAR